MLARVVMHVLARVVIHVLAHVLLHVLAPFSTILAHVVILVLARVLQHVLARVIIHVHDYPIVTFLLLGYASLKIVSNIKINIIRHDHQ